MEHASNQYQLGVDAPKGMRMHEVCQKCLPNGSESAPWFNIDLAAR
jgi:hypothetical protein